MLIDGATVTRYANSLKGLTLEQSQLALSTTNLSAHEKELILTKAGLINSTDKLTISEAASKIQKEASNIVDAKRLLQSAGLITAKELEEDATIKLTETLQESLKKSVSITGLDAYNTYFI